VITKPATIYQCEVCGTHRLSPHGAAHHEQWCQCRGCVHHLTDDGGPERAPVGYCELEHFGTGENGDSKFPRPFPCQDRQVDPAKLPALLRRHLRGQLCSRCRGERKVYPPGRTFTCYTEDDMLPCPDCGGSGWRKDQQAGR
jgi:hypothetical protein